jgi:hypothetical protein
VLFVYYYRGIRRYRSGKMRSIASRTKRPAHHGPIWLPAIGFYFLILILAAATFSFVIGSSADADRNGLWVTAGLISAGVIFAGIILRELVLRYVRERRIAEHHRLDRNLRHSPSGEGSRPKFTLEKNAAALESIRKRSDAANLFGNISAGHKEVFELCDEYREVVARELPKIHPDSPRLKALTKGSVLAGKLHRHHMLRWAEIEAQSLTSEAHSADTAAGRATYAQRAKDTIDFALSHYPEDRALRESADVLDEVIRSLNGFDVDEKGKPQREERHPDKEVVELRNVSSTKKKKAGGKKKL